MEKNKKQIYLKDFRAEAQHRINEQFSIPLITKTAGRTSVIVFNIVTVPLFYTVFDQVKDFLNE